MDMPILLKFYSKQHFAIAQQNIQTNIYRSNRLWYVTDWHTYTNSVIKYST